ncbi:MAG: DUF839 domain-containing protein [Pseudoxanthomonas sp.]
MNDGFAIHQHGGRPHLAAAKSFTSRPRPRAACCSLLAQSTDPSVLGHAGQHHAHALGRSAGVRRQPALDNYLRLVTQRGEVIPFAHNSMSRSEFAGVCFSPDGRILFVNIQDNGLTLAIEGDWSKPHESESSPSLSRCGAATRTAQSMTPTHASCWPGNQSAFLTQPVQ